MASSLSSVPPVKPRPRPETIGTFNPQAAKAGAKILFIQILCLSTNTGFHSSGQDSVSPCNQRQLPGMASSLSSVPPVKLNPRPDTIGTFNPQAAKAGASTWKEIHFSEKEKG